MKISRLKIVNFRGLTNIDFEIKQSFSIIVGPNAIGKSTIFEAIRLVKSLLAPTYMGETQEVLSEMRAWSPIRNALITDGIVGDSNKELTIQIDLSLLDNEITNIEKELSTLANMHVRNTHAIPQNVDDLGLVQFLSSPQGLIILGKAKEEVKEHIAQLKSKKTLSLSLIIDPTQSQTRGENLLDQEIATLLFRSTPPTHTFLSYFPADRSLPVGEVPLQIGMADMAEHVRSHISLPGRKYSRIKNFIVTRVLLSLEAREETTQDFNLIFKELLQGKSFESIQLSEHGNLSVKIKEESTGRTFDLDNMSSGEKGLILVFLIMKRTLVNGGVVLIDEPELHLNSSVCKRLLPFLIEHVLEPAGIQAIICTHSPEILGQAYDRDDCTLFHLRSGSDITPVLRKDKSEVFEALKRLGVNTDDVLFTRGTLYVEGDHDADLLEIGFGQRIQSYKISQLGGRNNIEKEIKTLYEEEKKSLLDVKQCFIFDLDRKPTNLTSTTMVKVEQWDRYCLENYLLEADMVYDACNEIGVTGALPSRGNMKGELKTLALKQMQPLVAKKIYQTIEPENAGFRQSEIEKQTSYQDISNILASRMQNIKTLLAAYDDDAWKLSYVNECKKLEGEMKPDWEENWHKHCDGKKLIHDLHRHLGIKASVLELKKKIMNNMKIGKSENWRIIDSILIGLLD